MKLSIIMPNLLTWDGTRPVVGGLERMAWALIQAARTAGFTVDVHQNGNSDWVKTIDGIAIHGHGLARLSLLAAMESIHHQTTRCLYLSIMQEPIAYRPYSLVVSHGVWWDAPGLDVRTQLESSRMALEQAQEVISVDYNFLNVIRAVYPSLAHKITVIPNFVNVNEFKPPVSPRLGPPVILFPRRLDPARGINLFLDAVQTLVDVHPDARFIMSVDQNNGPYNAHFESEIAALAFRDRVEVITTPFEKMSELYRLADIVVIPSSYSEGTSLSCLEAMASGCAVVATNVGGLTNLILSEYNGLLVAPRVDAISQAINRLIWDRELRNQLSQHAYESALSFRQERWQRAWTEALERVYGFPSGVGR
jgi:glycosyltransferase involved in cell wall biosynthesis